MVLKILRIGQAGLVVESDLGTKIMIDPYLSNSLFVKKGDAFRRLVPVNMNFYSYDIDILFISHTHEDHMNFDTLDEMLLERKTITVICPTSVYEKLKPKYYNHNFILFNPGVEISLGDVLCKAIYAEHEDVDAVGICMTLEDRTVYITGDTLYTSKIFDFINEKIDVLITCINGAGNNMNCVDAARLTNRLKPIIAIPYHYDMFEKYGEDPCNYSMLVGEDTKVLILDNYKIFEFNKGWKSEG